MTCRRPDMKKVDEKKQREAQEEAEAHFIAGLKYRGEVVPAGQENLPPGVTHESSQDDTGAPKRRRFSIVGH